ncbi:MAG: hypothetical protein RXQ68_00105 [Candidatus Nanopusillus sp.]
MVGKIRKIFGLDRIIGELGNKNQEYISLMEELRNYSKEIVEMAQKTYNIPEINKVNVLIGWVTSTSDYDAEQYKHQQSIKIDVHSIDGIYICESDMLHSPNEIVCTRYSDKSSFVLPNSDYFIQNIKDWSQKAAKLYPGKIKHPDQYISLSAFTSIDSKNPIISNPEVNIVKVDKDLYRVDYKDKENGFHSWMTYGLL